MQKIFQKFLKWILYHVKCCKNPECHCKKTEIDHFLYNEQNVEETDIQAFLSAILFSLKKSVSCTLFTNVLIGIIGFKLGTNPKQAYYLLEDLKKDDAANSANFGENFMILKFQEKLNKK